MDATPEVRTVYPGGSTSYSVFVALTVGPTALAQLMVSPMTVDLMGFTFHFTPSSGNPPFSSTLSVTVASTKAPGTYSIPVCGFSPAVGFRTDNVQLVVVPAAPTTDWAVASPTMNPVSPRVGDPVTFTVGLMSLGTTSPYPQNVRLRAVLDAAPLDVVVPYPGPTGALLTISSTSAPWMAKEGYHSLTVIADPTYQYNDPNRYNNQAVLSFTVSPAPPPFDFSLSVSPGVQKVTAGEPTSYSTTITLVSGGTQPVSLSLSGLPTGASYTFSPASSNPTFSSTISISTTTATPAGRYTLTLTGSATGRTQTASFELEVEAAPEKDFTITVTPESSTIEQGQQTTHVVTIRALAGFTSSVDLSIMGLPEGATAEFNPRSLTPGASSNLRIRVPRSTATGAYAVTLVGTGGGKTHYATLSLTITRSTSSPILDFVTENLYLLVIALLGVVIVALLVIVSRRSRGKPSTT